MKGFVLVMMFLALASVAPAQDAAANQMKIDSINDRMRGKIIPMQDNTAKPGGRNVNVADVIKKTNELNALVNSVNGDVITLNKGLLAADLTQKLKRIEKLAKDLRHSLE